jgi:hypothetical protein
MLFALFLLFYSYQKFGKNHDTKVTNSGDKIKSRYSKYSIAITRLLGTKF